ncbi:MAG TPA: triose-phosphate isomerase, partial [Methyloceanibacter sp.]
MTAIRPLVAGNWKMHGLAANLAELKSLQDLLAMGPRPETDIMICPPATLLAQARY